MKKFLSLLLAIMMVASLGMVAFATDTVYDDAIVGGLAKQDGAFVAFFETKDGAVDLGSAETTGASTVYFGENMYLAFVREGVEDDDFIDNLDTAYGANYPLVNVAAAVKNMKVSFYSLNADAQAFMDTANAQVVRKKVIYSTENPGTVEGISDDINDNDKRCLIDNAISSYAYFIEIPVKDYKKLEVDDKLFTGEIKIRVTKGDYEMEMDKTEFVFVPAQHEIDEAESDVIFENAKYYPAELFDTNDTEYVFTFDFEDTASSAFVVDMSKQRRDLKLGVDNEVADTEYDALMTEDNTMDFVMFNFEQVGMFSKVGTLYLYWNDELDNAVVYQIAEDGTLVKLTKAEAVYQDEKSDYPGCYAIKTNKLGRYLLVDKELKMTSLKDAAENTTPAAEKVIVTVEKEVIKEVPVEKIVEKEVIKEVEVKENNIAELIAIAAISLVVGAAAIYFLLAKKIIKK